MSAGLFAPACPKSASFLAPANLHAFANTLASDSFIPFSHAGQAVI